MLRSTHRHQVGETVVRRRTHREQTVQRTTRVVRRRNNRRSRSRSRNNCRWRWRRLIVRGWRWRRRCRGHRRFDLIHWRRYLIVRGWWRRCAAHRRQVRHRVVRRRAHREQTVQRSRRRSRRRYNLLLRRWRWRWRRCRGGSRRCDGNRCGGRRRTAHRRQIRHRVIRRRPHRRQIGNGHYNVSQQNIQLLLNTTTRGCIQYTQRINTTNQHNESIECLPHYMM